MPNALTLMMPATGAGTATVRSTEQGKDGTFAFEDVLNEEAALQDATPDAEADLLQSPEPGAQQTPGETEAAPPDSERAEPVPRQEHASATPMLSSNPEVAAGETAGVAAPADRARSSAAQFPAAQPRRPVDIPAAHPVPEMPHKDSALSPPSDTGNGTSGMRPIGESVTPEALSFTSKLETASNRAERRAHQTVGFDAAADATVANRITPQPTITGTADQASPAQIPIAAQTKDAVEALSSPEHDELPPLGDGRSGQAVRDMPVGLSPAAPRTEIARAVAGQLAAVISARPGAGGVEIALNPEELGRVSITLNGRDDGMHLVIMAERPETLDLMRRHIAILSAEFEQLGYGGLSLDLGMSGDAPPDGDPSQQDPAFTPTEAKDTAETLARPIPTSPEQGLDMRL